MKVCSSLVKASQVSFVFFAYSTCDLSVKMRLWRFSAMGHEQVSAEIFDPFLYKSKQRRF